MPEREPQRNGKYLRRILADTEATKWCEQGLAKSKQTIAVAGELNGKRKRKDGGVTCCFGCVAPRLLSFEIVRRGRRKCYRSKSVGKGKRRWLHRVI